MENNFNPNFDDIRPLRDEEVQPAINKITAEPSFIKSIMPYINSATGIDFIPEMKKCRTVIEFQKQISCPVLLKIFEKTNTKIEGSNWNYIDDEKSHLFISNHRDIVLDAAILNILMILNEKNTVEIAIGDNLLVIPWVSDLARLNKSFIVKRNLPVKQLLEKSKHLSLYINDTIVQRNQSVWIAQREGRAKDSNDCTQIGVLKMLSLYNKNNPLQALRDLNIVPLTVSYEYDPCDYLKAKEFQLKRDNAEFKKSFSDDAENMTAGIMGQKGTVHTRFGQPINNRIDKLDKSLNKADMISAIASIIDKEIHRNYVFFKHNYVAYDLMTNSHCFAKNYNKADWSQFNDYLAQQVKKIDIENKDETFLRMKIIEMYGNTVKNYLEAKEE